MSFFIDYVLGAPQNEYESAIDRYFRLQGLQLTADKTLDYLMQDDELENLQKENLRLQNRQIRGSSLPMNDDEADSGLGPRLAALAAKRGLNSPRIQFTEAVGLLGPITKARNNALSGAKNVGRIAGKLILRR
jgi:hypothetical protein